MEAKRQRRESLTEDAVEAPPQLPLTDGRYFACRRCRRILSEAQWYAAGCIECSATMGVPDRDSLLDFATPHFHNFIGLIAPEQSWVARLIMKSRAETNGIFAEMLSDDEMDEEEDDGMDDAGAGVDEGDEEGEEEELADGKMKKHGALEEEADDMYTDDTPATAPAAPSALAAAAAEESHPEDNVAADEAAPSLVPIRVKTEVDTQATAMADAPLGGADA